ncbi:MAG: Nif3-like dinuclear metal center hexameric protein [Clostridia bacterium]|nr:Nif3-like dinuclear metal center hexameric protein [Clostridia bacterium]
MKIKDVLDKIEKFAPLEISQDIINNGGYDNSGLIIGDREEEITGIVLAIDLSNEALDLAMEKNANLIITHHPFIYAPVSTITEDNIKGKLILRAIKQGVNVYSTHLCMDMTKGGIDDTVAVMLGINIESVFEKGEGYSYGKLGKIPFNTLQEFIDNAKSQFDYVHYLGNAKKDISTACSFCGQGTDGKTIAFAIENKVDVYVSCDIKHHEVFELYENGIAVVNLAHGESEFKAFVKIFEKLELEVPVSVCETDFKMI